MKILLSLILLALMSLANANADNIIAHNNIQHCLMNEQSMDMSAEQHLSGCCDISCAQHLVTDAQITPLESYISQPLLVVVNVDNFYTSFSSKMLLPPPIV